MNSSSRGIQMRKFKKAVWFVIMLLIISLLGGCSNKKGLAIKRAECRIYLKELPKGYEMLNKAIKDNIEIFLILRSVTNNKEHWISLTDKKNFEEVIRLNPGTYDLVLCKLYVKGFSNIDIKTNILFLEAYTDIEKVTLSREETFEVPVFIKDSPIFTETIKNSTVRDEILSLDIFSRKVQYNGEIIDLKNIRQIMTFTPKEKKDVKSYKAASIPAVEDPRVRMIVQNQTNNTCDISECTFIGVTFIGNNVVFPGGIVLGMDISEISHAKKGILGTPDYFIGSPVIGGAISDTWAVYVDDISGDRITFIINADKTFVSVIKYEFERYE